MENIRPEIEVFMRSCERLFGFTTKQGRLTDDECQVLEYYVEELNKHIAPVCESKEDCPVTKA